jgi:hypothetical protein
MIRAMKTSLLIFGVLLLQAGFMVAAYGSHMVGFRESGYLGLAIWALLPLGVACTACSRLLTISGWLAASRHRFALATSLSIVLPLIGLYAGAFVSLNAFGE